MTLDTDSESTDAYDVLATINAKARTTNVDAAGLSVSKTAVTVTEGGAVETFTVALAKQPLANVEVTVSSSGGQVEVAKGTSPSFAASQTLTFTDGDWNVAQTVTVKAVDDAVDEPASEPVDVTLDPRSAGGAADPWNTLTSTTVTATVNDDDATPTVTLSLMPSSIAEDGGVATVTASLSGTLTLREELAVSVSTAPAGDFTQTGTTLTISAGATLSTGAVVIVASANTADTSNKQVTVSGTVTGTNRVAAPSDVRLTIFDVDRDPQVSLVLSSSSISEDGGVATVTAALNKVVPGAVMVRVSATAVSESGAVDDDFMLSAARMLTITAGAMSSTGTVTVRAVNNAVDSPNKRVTISGIASGITPTPETVSVTLTLADDDPTPRATLVLSPSLISESGGVSTVTATLNRESSAEVTLMVSAAPGAGAAVGDFGLSMAKTLTIAAGSTTSTGAVTVTANGNAVDSPNKSVTVSATAAGGNGVTAPLSATLTLEDDDATPIVTLVLSDSSISERGGVSTVTAALSRESSAAVTVTVSAAPAGAVTLSARELVITAGSTTSMAPVTVSAVDNSVVAPARSVTVSGTASGGNGVGNPTGVPLTITDDDTPTVTLVLNPSSITEGGVSTVTATLDQTSTVAVTVTVSAAAGADADAADFTLSANRKLTIVAGVTTSSGAVTVTAVNDTADEADQTVRVSGSAETSVSEIVQPPAVTLTITDNDGPPTVSISSPTVTEGADETTATLTFQVTLDAASGKPVTVAYAEGTGGTATAGTDYTALASGTLTFAAGATSKAIDVTVTGDALDEDDETVVVALSQPSNAGLHGESAPECDHGYGHDLGRRRPADGVDLLAERGGGRQRFDDAFVRGDAERGER